jgi:SNF2 family DNA or RNA helicase
LAERGKEGKDEAEAFLKDLTCRREIVTPLQEIEPAEHQLYSASRIKGIKRYGVLHQMGTGKTVTTLLAAQDLWLENEITHLLIVAPLGVLDEWEDQISRFATVAHSIFWIANKVRDKRTQKAREFVQKRKGLSIGLINYEGLSTTSQLLLKDPPQMVVADESTRIKSRSAQMTKNSTALAKHAKYAVILTGTPTPNNVTEIFSQVKFLSTKYLGGRYGTFINRYAVKGGWQGKQIVGSQNEEELRKVLSFFSDVVTKEEAIPGLPEQTYAVRKVDLTGAQRAAYNDAQSDFMFAVDAVNSSDASEKEYNVLVRNALARLAFCQRIASGHVREEDNFDVVRFKDNPKAKAVIEVIQDAGNVPVIIFARFREDIFLLQKAITDAIGCSVSIYCGGLHDAEEQKARFKKGGSQIFISQVQKGGYGLNLTMSNLCIFYNNWFSYGVRDQAESRIHRRGQERSCHYIDIIARDTVDEQILEAIRQKESLAKILFGKDINVDDSLEDE